MRDLGLTRKEALAKVERLTRAMNEQFDIMDNRKAALAKVGRHYANDDEYSAAERAKIARGSERSDVLDSGVLPWLEQDMGNVLDGDVQVWAARVMARTFPSPAFERVVVKALRLVFTSGGQREHSLTITSREALEELARQVTDELALWEEEE